MKLRAWTTGTSLAHHPEVVLHVAIHNLALGITSCFFKQYRPEVISFLVELPWITLSRHVNGRIKPIRRKPPTLNDKLPSPLNGFLFKVVTKAPVTEHLEHRVVVGIITNILQIVVLTTSTDTLLGISGTWR